LLKFERKQKKKARGKKRNLWGNGGFPRRRFGKRVQRENGVRSLNCGGVKTSAEKKKPKVVLRWWKKTPLINQKAESGKLGRGWFELVRQKGGGNHNCLKNGVTSKRGSQWGVGLTKKRSIK